MRMTPSRRDFLRLTTYNDVLVSKDISKFVSYKIYGQLKKRQSLKSFDLYLKYGYLNEVPCADPNFYRFKATKRTHNLFKGFKHG